MNQSDKTTSAIHGLSAAQVVRAARAGGSNRLEAQKSKSILRRILENLGDPIIRILLIALGLQILFSMGHVDWLETSGILLAIIVSTTVSSASEYGSEKAFKRLQHQAAEQKCRVVRDGVITQIPTDDVVCGDVLILSAGDAVPADARLLDGELGVDQSALNGENEEAQKYPTHAKVVSDDLSDPGAVFRGSTVLSGSARVLVCRVGENTHYGKIAHELQLQTRDSPLKHRLSLLAGQISLIGYIAAALIAVVYLYRYFIADAGFSGAAILYRLRTPSCLFPALLHAFTLAVTMIVVAVPEGLPMMITVVLSSNMKRMLKDHVLVKKMVGIETAGSMDLLFCDKTGTLTTGVMTLERIITPQGREIRGLSSLRTAPRLHTLLSLNAYYNTESVVRDREIIGGNATDRAILRAFSRGAGSPDAQALRHIPFDSTRRYRAVQLSTPESITLIKGAPEVLLSRLTHQLDEDGVAIPLRERDISTVIEKWHASAKSGERVIAVCSARQWFSDISSVQEMTLLGLLCLKDKVRSDAPRAVERLHRGGIRVVMITGDNRDTAASIAAECGIYRPGSDQIVIDGPQMAQKSDSEIIALLPRLRVVARALPSDKSRLVRLSQQAGMVVGMTGDGVNDAPSLKIADVGFAIGQGTDIAKEAADIVLLDGRIGSIVNTVLYGRTVFHSIRKFITFQLMMNLCAVGVSLIGQHVGIEHPITIVQMLWVNMIMDTLGGLAFSGEAPLDEYMREPPKKRSESILTPSMIHQIVFSGGFTLLLCSLFLSVESIRAFFRFREDAQPYLTAFFLLFIFCGIFNCFNVRTERLNLFANLFRNPLFCCIMLLIAVVQTCMVYVGGPVFRSVPLSVSSYMTVVGLAFCVVPFEFFRKISYKMRKKKRKTILKSTKKAHASSFI